MYFVNLSVPKYDEWTAGRVESYSTLNNLAYNPSERDFQSSFTILFFFHLKLLKVHETHLFIFKRWKSAENNLLTFKQMALSDEIQNLLVSIIHDKKEFIHLDFRQILKCKQALDI